MTINETTRLSGGDMDTLKEAPIQVPATLELDAAKYRADVEEFEMTDAQKAELLETLWSIMRSFVELGFSVNICEQILENAGAVSGGAPNGVKSLNSRAAAETPSDGTDKESA
jgi:hypothetical protein